MLEMVKFIDQVCKENNIQYILDGGSALGAVRHQGFIPWDDDMDIALLEPDYKRLIKILLNIKSGKYVLQTQSTDFNYINAFPKFRMREGNFLGSNPNRGKLYKWRGPAIDIFCFQKNSYWAARISSSLRSRLLFWTWKINTLWLRYAITKLMFGIYYCSLPFIKLLNILHKEGEMHNALGQGWPHLYIWEKHVTPIIRVKFEDTMLPVPEQYDGFLTDLFGDWRTPPSEEEIRRKGTHSKELTNN